MSQSRGISELDDAAREPPGLVVRIELDRLQLGPTLRLGGIRRDHVNALVQAHGNWPPVLVRQEDNSIVDGCYRFLAAQRLGHSHLSCVYFEGAAEAVFFEALKQNLHHGLPLSLREREKAAQRILTLHSEWSDRRISELCALSPGTIRRLREVACPAEQNGHVNERWGRDGKRYPANPDASRARIVTALREEPARSLRSIAQVTKTSPETVRAVKVGLARSRLAASTPAPMRQLPKAPKLSCDNQITDAAILSTDEGKAFATWFEQTHIGDEWRDLVKSIPISRIYEMADEGRRRSKQWLDFASTIERDATRRAKELGT
jgi:ParB-like chromosome segregation protein Spo0J